MKKTLSILLLLSFVLLLLAPAGQAAQATPKLFLDGNQLETEIPPIIQSGFTLVPLAVLSSNLGYDVKWDNAAKKVTVGKDGTVIEMVIGLKAVQVNGEVREAEAAPVLMKDSLKKDRTMVPVRLVGELLGLQFQWNQQEKAVYMTRPAPPAVPDPGPIGGGTDPTQPATGYIQAIMMDELSVIQVVHDGSGKPDVKLYDSPKRIVFDFFNTKLAAHFPAGQTKVEIADNVLLTSYRYAQNNETMVRLVVDAGADTGYYMTESEGLISIALMPSSEVPAVPETPGGGQTEEPGVPAEPGTPDDSVFDIVIDAGHGGTDPGAPSVLAGKNEKMFNLAVALKLKALLDQDPRIRVHMTRTGDTYPTLSERVAFAEQVKADLFLSIHANSFKDNPAVNGTETYYYHDHSKPLADIIHKHLLEATGLKDRKVKKTGFKVIKDTTMPSVLIEAGFLSNEGDAKKLFTEDVQNKIAAKLADGIKEYLNLK